MVRLPQGSWFPWSEEFRWDRLPWTGTTDAEVSAILDQRLLAALVEAVATTMGPVLMDAGYEFRPDASGVGARNGVRQAFVLYEADGDEVADRYPVLAGERGSCSDVWVYWSPSTGELDVSLPGGMLEGDDATEVIRQPATDAEGLKAQLLAWADVIQQALMG